MRLLALSLLLPACLIAPDRPPLPMIDPGTPLTVDPANCTLAATAILSANTIGPLPGGGDALWRAGFDQTILRVYAFVPGDPGGTSCTKLSFALPPPVPPKPTIGAGMLAMDVTAIGEQTLVTMMYDNGSGTLSFTAVELDSDGSGSVTSSLESPLVISPPTIGLDQVSRFLHRMTMRNELWFGGGSQVGVLAESTPGRINPPVFYDPQEGSQSWFDAIPLPFVDAVQADVAILIGEVTTCGAAKLPSSTLLTYGTAISDRGCAKGACPEVVSHVVQGAPGWAGVSATQPDRTGNFELDLLGTNEAAVQAMLVPPSDYTWGEDVVVVPRNNDLDAVVLWLPATGPGTGSGKLAHYPGVTTSTSSTLSSHTDPVDVPGWATELLQGVFTRGQQEVVIVGGKAMEVQCVLGDNTLGPC